MCLQLKDLYWAAGFIEGEGCFSFDGKKPLLRVVQVEKEPIDRLQKIFNLGRIRLEPRGGRQQPIYWWAVYGGVAAAIMMTLYLLMSPRRQQKIKEILSAWKATPGRTYNVPTE